MKLRGIRLWLGLGFLGLSCTIPASALAQVNPCGIGAASVDPPAGPAQVDDKWPSQAGGQEYRRYVRGGADVRVLVEINAGISFPALTITLLSKSLDADGWNRPFQERCSSQLTKATEVIGRDDKSGTASLLWMMRISTDPLGASLQTFRIRVWESEAPTRSAQRSVSTMLGIVPELACQVGTRTRYQAGSQGQTPFATRAMLAVAVDDQDVPLQTSVRGKLVY